MMWTIMILLFLACLALILPNFLFFLTAFTALESYCMLICRHREKMVRSGQWQDDELSFRAMAAKDSRFGTYRPLLSTVCVIGIIISVAKALDEYGQCFWNWECWSDVDCSVSILLPAVLSCVFLVVKSSDSLSLIFR